VEKEHQGYSPQEDNIIIICNYNIKIIFFFNHISLNHTSLNHVPIINVIYNNFQFTSLFCYILLTSMPQMPILPINGEFQWNEDVCQ